MNSLQGSFLRLNCQAIYCSGFHKQVSHWHCSNFFSGFESYSLITLSEEEGLPHHARHSAWAHTIPLHLSFLICKPVIGIPCYRAAVGYQCVLSAAAMLSTLYARETVTTVCCCFILKSLLRESLTDTWEFTSLLLSLTDMHTHTCTHMYIYTHTHKHIHTCTYTPCIYIHTYIHVHTHMHTCTHTYSYAFI